MGREADPAPAGLAQQPRHPLTGDPQAHPRPHLVVHPRRAGSRTPFEAPSITTTTALRR